MRVEIDIWSGNVGITVEGVGLERGSYNSGEIF
jgi:hypothetical protein